MVRFEVSVLGRDTLDQGRDPLGPEASNHAIRLYAATNRGIRAVHSLGQAAPTHRGFHLKSVVGAGV